ncbi:hypothetical protein [uncultured Blautia sp.]|uniref:hypothetical protein n=1 Tax=uncultured Blautia sp. TaxID=765821 RepID=UPI00280C0192|nr:hypothetical protein [uncultured Blautia sp.]
MKIRFIRHGDPDYVNDTLTEKGRKEAELLAKAADRLGLLYVASWKSYGYSGIFAGSSRKEGGDSGLA